jgi:hypothetical protein
MGPFTRVSWIGIAAPLSVAAVLALVPVPLSAGGDPEPVDDTTGAVTPAPIEDPSTADSEAFPARAGVRVLIEKETATTRLPADIAEAVVFVESRFDSSVIGRVGEIGLMQVRPGTAAMLGFKGTTVELATPEINIHYGVTYLAQAWRLARGDLCRGLMKYRAGLGEEVMTPRSVIYCNRARNRLIAMNSPFAAPVTAMTGTATPAAVTAIAPPARAKPQASLPAPPTDVYATYKRGTPAASRAFWAAQEARVRAIKARIEAKWRRVASR